MALKIDLEEGRETAAAEDLVEVEITFRIYFYARDHRRPKLDNLAMRQALGLAFRDGIPVGEDVIPIDEGLSFTVTDGGVDGRAGAAAGSGAGDAGGRPHGDPVPAVHDRMSPAPEGGGRKEKE